MASEVTTVIAEIILNETSGSPDDEDRDKVLEMITITSKKPAIILGTSRILTYVEETVSTYSDPMFKAHFRMSRSSFQSLMEMVGPLTVVRTVSLEKRLLACVWYLSNQETFRGVADRFGISKGSLHYYLGNFCRVMCSQDILPSMICWPDHTAYENIANGFSYRRGFPGVIGALDGTYIPISGPTQFRDSYICRKGYPAFHLQGVCDTSLKFIDVFCAYPGSVHDSRVFRNCPLHNHLENECPNNYHLLGDSAYCLSKFLLVPFRDNGHLTPEQKFFNFAHSSTRVDIERCFGLLKGKFRKLKFLDVKKVSIIPHIIVACCVLHNFIINKESYVEDDIDNNHEGDVAYMYNSAERTDLLAVSKRDEIMNLLA